MRAVRRGGVARKSSSGAGCGQVHPETSSLRVRLEGTATAAAQSFSIPSSSELTSPQPRGLFIVLDPTGQLGNLHQDRRLEKVTSGNDLLPAT